MHLSHCVYRWTSNICQRATPQLSVVLSKCCTSWQTVGVANVVTRGSPALTALLQARQKGTTQGSKERWPGEKLRKETIALIVDADNQGIPQIQNALHVLKKRAGVITTTVFAEPRRLESTKWKDFIQTNQIAFKSVSRDEGRLDDPNDQAIFRYLEALLSQGSTDCFALLVTDTDFLPLASKVVSQGKEHIVFLPRNKPGMARAFKDVGSKVVLLDPDSMGHMDKPRMMAVLQADGTGLLKEIEESPDDSPSVDVSSLAKVLRGLHFRDNDCDPIAPAIAKFWHTNSLGSIVVWPLDMACAMLATTLHQHPHQQWRSGQSDVAFVLPRSVSAGSLALYGTRLCAQIAAGGGPFIVRNSPTLTEHVLRKMGYLDDSLNRSVDEALEVFRSSSINKRALREVGTSIEDSSGIADKMVALRSAFLSSRAHGTWQIPPRDESIRKLLAAKRVLPSPDASKREVLEAMQIYIRQNGLRPMSTYNACVSQCTLHLNRDHPLRRS